MLILHIALNVLPHKFFAVVVQAMGFKVQVQVLFLSEYYCLFSAFLFTFEVNEISNPGPDFLQIFGDLLLEKQK